MKYVSSFAYVSSFIFYNMHTQQSIILEYVYCQKTTHTIFVALPMYPIIRMKLFCVRILSKKKNVQCDLHSLVDERCSFEYLNSHKKAREGGEGGQDP